MGSSSRVLMEAKLCAWTERGGRHDTELENKIKV